MSSMPTSHTFNMTGGTFTHVHGDAHYHGFRGPDASDILHRTTATAAFHNSKERFDPPKCHHNTRMAILTKIMKWIKWEEDLYAFIMWVYGPAGAGKSAIAQTIAEMCEDEMILLASFFFSRNDPSRSNVNALVATIAYQITLNLPDAREAIFGAIERDPLIFSKSLAIQVKSLIVEPLQPLGEGGYFNNPTSRRLVIIDGLDECSEPRVQRNIVETIAHAQRLHQLPLIFLFASRPEQDISLAFSMGVLPRVTTRIALDESYAPDNDIALFLTDKFQEIKSTHRLRAYIPSHWPVPDVLNQLVEKSSGQFIYASTVIRYVSSIRHKPTDRLDIVLGIRPPQRDLPFSELDALYTQILGGVEDIECVLDILSFALFNEYSPPTTMVETFLSLQPGDVELHLGDLRSLINIEPDRSIRVLHASLTDFFVDPTRSKTFWINRRDRHTAFARQCLQILQCMGNVGRLWIGYDNIVYHLENAEITPELRDDLNNFSFDCLQDVLKGCTHWMTINIFSPLFLECLKRLPLPEVYQIPQTFQADFDRILCNVLEKYHCWPGFALLLGSILHYTNFKHQSFTFPPGLVASLYLVRQQGEGHIQMLDDTGFSGINTPCAQIPGTSTFLAYFIEFLVNSERSGARAFDQQSYATATKECLQLCLYNRPKFSEGATGSACRDKVLRYLRRDKPWAWKARLGVHSRIHEAMHRVTVRQWKSFKASTDYGVNQHYSFPHDSFKHGCYRSLAYQWRLDLLPIFLEKSAISLELADVLRTRTFTTMAQRFPRRMRLAKEAITAYLLRVDSAVCGP